MLLGKCRYCKKPISIQYPLVEATVGFLFSLAMFVLINHYQLIPEEIFLPGKIQAIFWLHLVFTFIIISTLTIISVYDLLNGYILDEYVLFSAVTTLFFQFIYFALNNFSLFSESGSVPRLEDLLPIPQVSFPPTIIPLISYILPIFSGVAVAGMFLLLVLGTKGKGMGGGDIKLGFLVGLLTGWPGAIVAVFFSFLTGALFSVLLIFLRIKRLGETVPFGPFLSLGTLIAMLWGDKMIAFYTQRLLGL